MYKSASGVILRHPFLQVLIICMIGGMVYANSLQNAFQFDDHAFILNNSIVTDPLNPEAQEKFWSVGHKTRIVGFATFALNYFLHGTNVVGYHLTNIVIHLISACLVFWIVNLMRRAPRLRNLASGSDAAWMPLFAALLFVVHPVQTQAVTYIYQRLASLAAMFYLLSVASYLCGRLRSDGRYGRWFALAGVSALLGMLTKETVFTLPIVIVFLELYLMRSPAGTSSVRQGSNLGRYVPLLFLLIIPVFLALDYDLSSVFAPRVLRAGSHELITSQIYLFTQFNVIVHYIRLLLIPVGQNLDYDFPLSMGLFDGATWISLCVLLGVVYLGWKCRRSNPWVCIGVFWFFVTLAVESSVIPIRYVIWEHRLYLSMPGFVLAISGVIFARPKLSRTVWIALALIIAMLSVLTVQRNRVWATEISLWEDVTRKSPLKPYAHFALGSAYQKAERYDDAFKSYRRTLGLFEQRQKYKDIAFLAQVHQNMMILFEKTGQPRQADAAYAEMMRYRDEVQKEYLRLGLQSIDAGEYDDALYYLRRSTLGRLKFPEAYHQMGLAYRKLDRMDESAKSLQEALELYTAAGDGKGMTEIQHLINTP